MAYRAEIEIIAKGVTKVTQLQKNLNQLATQIDHLNGPGSLGDFNKQLAQATKLMGRAQQGTVEEKRAIEQYVVALNNANQAQARTNKLIAEEIRQRNGATIALRKYNAAAVPGRQPGSMSGRYLRPLGRSQSAVSLGPQPDRTKMLRRQAVLDRTVRRTQQLSGLQQGLAKLAKVEADSRLDAARSASQQVGEMAAIAREAKQINQYSRPIGPQPARPARAGGGGGRSSGGRRGSRFTDIATGAGFPLLFGGGPLQALAGGVGGAFGGLGGAIAGSAIVAQVEAFATAAAQTGVALTSTSGALELMREKSLFSSEAAKEHAAVLEELGQVEELAAHLGQEMAKAIGNNGVQALKDLGDTTKETTRLWNLLTTQLFKLVSGPLNSFLEAINRVLGQVTTGSSFDALLEDLAPDQRAKAEARFEELRGRVGTGRSAAQSQRLTDTEAQKIVLEEFKGLQKAAAIPLPITDEDRRSIKPPKGRQKKDRLPSLDIELGLKERLLGLNKQIAQAALEEDRVNKTLLEKEKVRETLAAEIDKIKTKGLKSDVEAAEIAIARVDAAQKIQDIDNKTAQFKAQQAEKGQEVISSLENEKALLEARLNGTENQVALTQLIAEKTKGMSEEDAKRTTELLKGVDALKQQNAEADKMQAIYDRIGQSIASGVVDTLSAAVDQTKSLADAAANTLRNIANTLLQLGVNTALGAAFPGSSLFKNLPGFASGGRPPVNRPSIVGERGPELFVPRSSGTIVPNHAMGGSTNVVVNVDAKGTAAQGDDAQAGQLGRLIGAAVQAELVKQKRPGGLLTR